MTEEWRAIPGFPEYEASNVGNIRSWKPRSPTAATPEAPRILSQYHNAKVGGYHYVTLRRDGKNVLRRVHVLVAATFIGPCPTGTEVMHLDHNPCVNAVGNLRYGTHAENMSFTTKEARNARR